MNLRCDDTFVEDSHWHRQAKRYNDFVYKASDKSLLLLEFGVGFNTPASAFPFEQMAAQLPDTPPSYVSTRDFPQPSLQGIKNYVGITEDVTKII